MSRLGQQMFYVAKAKRQLQDVGHEGVVTGCDTFSLRSSNGLAPGSHL
ncbi:hypothetical protein ACQKII_07080 [Lysinibacillus sp. NPDC048646]